MASYNDVTGDKIQSRTNTKAFEDNFDKIFRNKVKEVNVVNQATKEEEWDEKRIDIIGSNGNVGYTPEQINGVDSSKQGEEK